MKQKRQVCLHTRLGLCGHQEALRPAQIQTVPAPCTAAHTACIGFVVGTTSLLEVACTDRNRDLQHRQSGVSGKRSACGMLLLPVRHISCIPRKKRPSVSSLQTAQRDRTVCCTAGANGVHRAHSDHDSAMGLRANTEQHRHSAVIKSMVEQGRGISRLLDNTGQAAARDTSLIV
jgi:hypothetical protein